MQKGLRFFLIFALLFSGGSASTATEPSTEFVQLERIATATLASDLKFKGTRVGGLSGLVFDPDSKNWIAVSDDRGRNQEPRFYLLDLKLKKNGDKGWKFDVDLKDVKFLHMKGEKRWKQGVLDLEGVTLLPWGNLLISTEGDNNKKPRALPSLLDIKMDGTWARDFTLPDELLPEKAGVQTKGIQNNRGPEGLTGTGDGKIWAAVEGTLIQDIKTKPRQIRIVQYEMPEAWVIKPTSTFYYPIESASETALLSESGVSEIFWLKDRDLWVLERSLELSSAGLNYEVKLFQVTLSDPGSLLKKRLILDFKKYGDRVTNFEALAWGPTLPDGRKTLIALSDNNFQKSEKTEFWVFALGTEKKE